MFNSFYLGKYVSLKFMNWSRETFADFAKWQSLSLPCYLWWLSCCKNVECTPKTNNENKSVLPVEHMINAFDYQFFSLSFF